jgi:hypothetical protein
VGALHGALGHRSAMQSAAAGADVLGAVQHSARPSGELWVNVHRAATALAASDRGNDGTGGDRDWAGPGRDVGHQLEKALGEHFNKYPDARYARLGLTLSTASPASADRRVAFPLTS